MHRAPDHTEAAEYYFTYIGKVPAGDIRHILAEQAGETLTRLRAISDVQSLLRYAPGKWSIRDLVAHLNDSERVFSLRALWFARGFDGALPSFDQDVGCSAAAADARSWDSHLDEFAAIRSATVALFDNLPAPAWDRRGIASGTPVTVRALAYICAGHVEHHLRIINERYI